MYDMLQYAAFGIASGGIYALLALGFSLIYQTTGLLSFVHPQVMMVGGMVGYTLLAQAGLPPALAAVGSAVAGAVLSVLIDVAVLAPIRRRSGSDLHMVVATIGLGIILVSAATLIWGPYSLPYPQADTARVLIMGYSLDRANLNVLGATAFALIAFQLLLTRTNIGLAMRASAMDTITAGIVGIPVRRMTIAAYAFSGALAGLAGALIGSMYYASFEMGGSGLKALAAAVLGGFGNLTGAVIGGFALGMLESTSSFYIGGQYNDSLIYGILILVLLIWPQGLLGRKEREL